MSKTARLMIGALLLGIAALIVGAMLPDALKLQVAPLLRNIASGLFLTAGVLRLAAWRLTRDWAIARSGLILLVLGTALPATSTLRFLVHDGPVVDLEAPETRLLFVLPIVALAVAGATQNARLMRRTLAVLATVTVGVPIVLSLVATSAPSEEHFRTLWLAAEGLAAAAWSALAFQARYQRQRSRTSTAQWFTAGLPLMAAAEICKAWSLADADAPRGLGGYLQLMAAMVALGAALSGLWISIRADGADSADLTRALVDTERRLANVEERQRQRLHDARSAIIGVVGASELLAMPGISANVDPARLRALMADELRRLQGLLEIEIREPIVEFALADALDSVVLSHQVEGMTIDVQWHDLQVIGRPQATATVLDNLLRNVSRHAPDARVRISARPIDADIEIVVEDDGPGIPVGERRSVLHAGVRGTTAQGDGSGLGLYTAATAMAAQSGTLRVGVRRHGGTRIALTLPGSLAHRPYALVG